MPDITELLDRAAPGTAGPAPLDDIVRRGRRRRMATRAAVVGGPLAVTAVVVGVFLTGGSPTGVVIDPPPMAEDPGPTPSPSASTSPDSEPEPDDDRVPDQPTVDGWIAPAGLAADLLLVDADGGAPAVVRLAADGGSSRLDLEAGVPNDAGLLPDGAGGFVWQPDWESAGPAPVLHRTADGQVRTLAESPDDAELRLVGWDRGLGRPLGTLRRGTTPEDATSDLVALAMDGSGWEPVAADVGGWESGVAHAVMREIALYDRYVEASQHVVLDPPDGDPQVVYEAGEVTGENIAGVGVMPEPNRGVALVSGMPGLDEEMHARLLFVDLASGQIIEEVDVPLGEGFESDAAWPGGTARDVVVQGDDVLVNRWFEGEWVAPLVYDRAAGSWSLLEHQSGDPVIGRAFLAPPAPASEAAAAACVTEDAELLNAAPDSGDELYLYVPCKDAPQAGDVHRLPADVEPSRQVEQNLTTMLERLIQPVIDEDLANRGYYFPADRGQPVLQSVDVGPDGAAVVDFDFPNGVGNLSTSYAGAMWHQSLLGTVFQFDQIETVEFRLDGSCDDYTNAFQAGGCPVFDRADAPWNREGP